ncbi:E3 ubiquitin protein ligase UPL1-like protein [Tanacetum coccineum]
MEIAKNLNLLFTRLSDKVYTLTGELMKKSASIVPSHRKFFIVKLSDLARSLSSKAVQELITLINTQMLGLSTGSMAGSSVMRILQTLNSLTLSMVILHFLLELRASPASKCFCQTRSGLLEKSLSMLLKAPKLMDFDNKRSYFRSRIRKQYEQLLAGPLRVTVRRAYVLEDSYNQLWMRSIHDMKRLLNVHFRGEDGIDACGLTREWYQLFRVIFDKGALLFTTGGNNTTFQPNPNYDCVIAPLQQPVPLEYIPVEAEYQKDFSELLQSATRDYGTLAASISDIHWTHKFQEPPSVWRIYCVTPMNISHLGNVSPRFQKGENQEGEDETHNDVDKTNGRRLSWHSDMDNGL